MSSLMLMAFRMSQICWQNYMLKDFTCHIGAEIQLFIVVKSYVHYQCGYVLTFLCER